MTKKTVQQMTQKAKNLLISLTPEEKKTRENNIAHIVHLGEEMKKLLVKWEEEIKVERDQVLKTIKEINKEKLEDWLNDIRAVLDAMAVSPIYIPTVREEWIRVINQKEDY